MQWTAVQRASGGARATPVRDTQLVLAARDGDPDAFGQLFDRWLDRVFDVAYRIVHNRDTAAEVAQDVFLVAWQQLATLEQPDSFGGWLLRTSRNRALNRLEKEGRSTAIGDEVTTMVIDSRTPAADASGPVEQREQVDLVWAAAAALGERDTSVLDLHLRHGFGAAEIGEALGVTTNNAHQLLFRLKARLAAAVKGWVLWQDGAPSCASLASALGGAGITRFGAAAVAAIERHATACAECIDRQQLRLSPEAMFSAVPIVAAGPFLKTKVCAALSGAGVPMGGSEAATTGELPESEAARPHRLRPMQMAALVAAVVLVLVAVAVIAEPLDRDGARHAELASADATTTLPQTPGATAAAVGTGPSIAVAPGQTTTTTTRPGTTVTTTPGAVTTTPTIRPPATTASSTSTTVPTGTTAPPAPPAITSFTATLGTFGQPPCGSSERRISISWSSTGGRTARLAGPGASPTNVSPSGSATRCVAPGVPTPTFTLSVTSPGGTDTAVATAT
jgi:RNA polymerase sigma factor (sigma-70 family)